MSYKDQTQRSLDTAPGFLIRSPGMPHRTVLPNWDHETQIRIFPAPHEDGGFKCTRESSVDNDFSDAVWAEPVARSLGVKEQFTYIDRIPGVSGKTPTSLFIDGITTLIKEKPREVPEAWLKWTEGGKTRAAKVQKVKTHIFWQGMELMRKGKMLKNAQGQLQPQWPVLIMGAVSLQMSFEMAGNKRVPTYQGAAPESIKGDDLASRAQRDQIYAQMFMIGDWCSIEHGRIMSIFQASASDTFEKPHYSFKLLGEFPLTSIADVIRQQWRPWDQLLRYHTAEEHVQMLCRAFPAEAVDYVFGATDLRDLLPATYKDAWKRYQATLHTWAPGFPTQGQPQQMPQGMYSYPPQQGTAAPQPNQGTAAPQLPPGVPTPQYQVQAPQPIQPMQAPMNPYQTQAPQPTLPVSAPQPTAPQPTAVGGMQVNFSGAPIEDSPDEGAIMQSGGFAETPQEFEYQQYAQAPAPAVAPQPTMPVQQPAPLVQGTPAGASPVVDQAQLQKALENLKNQRDKAARGGS